MPGEVVLLHPYPNARALRELATARHAEALGCAAVGDAEGCLSRLRDVEALRVEARRSAAWAERCDAAGRGAAAVLEIAERRHAIEAGVSDVG